RWPRDWSSDVCSSDLVARQERLEGRPDVFLPLDQHGLEVLGLEPAEDVQHRALVVAGPERLDLTVAEEIADVSQLLGGAQRRRRSEERRVGKEGRSAS